MSVTILSSSNALFQVSVTVAVLALAYGLHAKYQPFVRPESHKRALSNGSEATSARSCPTQVGAQARAAGLEGAMSRRRSSVAEFSRAATAAALDVAEEVRHELDLNTLETMFLGCSIGLVLGGLTFQSARFEEGSAAYVFLAVLISLVLVGSILQFCFIVVVETYRSWKARAISSPRPERVATIHAIDRFKSISLSRFHRGQP